MFSNRSKYFDETLKVVQMGYEEYALDLVKNALLAASRNELNDSHKDYFKICLSNLSLSGDLEKSFYLKNSRGQKRKAAALRDLFVAYEMVISEQSTLNYEERLEQTVVATNKRFKESLIDKKSVERFYTKHKEKILKDIQNAESYLLIFKAPLN